MILFANLLAALGLVVRSLTTIIYIALLARVVASWLQADPHNPICRAATALSDPVVKAVRRRVRTEFGGFDLSVLFAFVLVMVVQVVLGDSLEDYALRFKMSASARDLVPSPATRIP